MKTTMDNLTSLFRTLAALMLAIVLIAGAVTMAGAGKEPAAVQPQAFQLATPEPPEETPDATVTATDEITPEPTETATATEEPAETATPDPSDTISAVARALIAAIVAIIQRIVAAMAAGG